MASAQQCDKHHSRFLLLLLSAIGVVFGDIGTSPLYTLKTILSVSGNSLLEQDILGLISLLFWTLVIVVSVKYIFFAMRVDNDGEGGILALMSLLGIKKHKRPVIITLGLIGAALIYGDGAITPAISVLSALEGLNVVFPEAQHYVLPLTLVILILLFAIQPLGTARIGITFAPVMLLWFISIGLLGIRGIVENPVVLKAVNPFYGLTFLFSRGYISFLTLGAIFLCVTGAEALYADMGHFGAKPIRVAWFGVVFPGLFLNYAGQAGIVLSGNDISQNPFFMLCPPPLLVPLVILATLATIIASQAIISGAFSMTRQAIQLGWLPRLRVQQTSEQGYGQIYIGVVNWSLMIMTVGLALLFKSSDQLASAYGIAVSLTMLMTSVLLFIAMREIWHWNKWLSFAIVGVFIAIDVVFVLANMMKIIDGGYIPLLLAVIICCIMLVWRRGKNAVLKIVNEKTQSVTSFLAEINRHQIPRVTGTAIFLTRSLNDGPLVMKWHVKCNQVLHANIITLNVDVKNIPWVSQNERLYIEEIAPHFWRVKAFYGFMETPDIPALWRKTKLFSKELSLENAIYYLGHETIVSSQQRSRLPGWQRGIFIFMNKNSVHVTDLYQLPSDRVVEIGRRVAI